VAGHLGSVYMASRIEESKRKSVQNVAHVTAAKTPEVGHLENTSDKGTFGAIWEAYENYHVALLCIGVTGAFVSGGFSAGILFLLGWEEIRSFAHGISLFWDYLRAVAPLSAAAFFYVFVSLELQKLANVWVFGIPLVLGSWIAERITGRSYQCFGTPLRSNMNRVRLSTSTTCCLYYRDTGEQTPSRSSSPHF